MTSICGEIYAIFRKIVSAKRGNIEMKRAGRKLGDAIDWWSDSLRSARDNEDK